MIAMKAVRSAVVLVLCAIHCGADYAEERAKFLQDERNAAFGGDVVLDRKELRANSVLIAYKQEELALGFEDSSRFLPGVNFFQSRADMELSHVFDIIARMPKGAMLHGHDFALVSDEFVFNQTYRDDLYICVSDQKEVKLKFMSAQMRRKQEDCSWALLSKVRAESTNVQKFDQWLSAQLTLISDTPYKDVNDVWRRFQSLFGTIIPFLSYRPVFEDLFLQTLKEFHQDNVMYLEVRGVLPPVYELNGTIHEPMALVGMMHRIVQEFKQDHPDFFGAKFIYAPSRKVGESQVESYIDLAVAMVQKYPDFVIGFDLVGQEDMGRPLVDFIKQIQAAPANLSFFFHAGETNWNGLTDLNLVDALLLGTKRIGHGYAAFKHQKVINEIIRRDIALEVSPISNQVLKLVEDLRNHPAVSFLAWNLPVVITCDDPGLWGARGLSYDFYEAFMGFFPSDADLRVLKKLALNSIKYSVLTAEERNEAYLLFYKQWDMFLDSFT